MSELEVHAQASLIDTEVRAIESQHTGKQYRISIGLPDTYADEPDRTWPVVYLTDANFHFGMVTEMIRVMAALGMTSDAIVVGIGYPGTGKRWDVWKHIWALRAHDLTPEPDGQREAFDSAFAGRTVQYGGAPAFLAFLKDELIPTIENTYPANPAHRILAGHSLGGLFTVFALFQEPGLFHSYIASSAGFDRKDRDDRLLLRYESQFASTSTNLPAQLFLSYGELEESADECGISEMYRFHAMLESRHYTGLSLVKRIFPDEDHVTVIAPALHAGLKMSLKKHPHR